MLARFELREGRRSNSSQISRLDPRLLSDPEGCLLLDTRFGELLGQSLPEWNPHVRLEYLKMCIRTAANDANGKIKAKLRDTEQELNKDINDVVSELSTVVSPERKELLMHKLDDLRQLKRSLVEKIGTKLEQRTARKWYNEGELSNKYFFNLLNRRANNDFNSVLDVTGAEVKDPKQVEDNIRQFYKRLYETPNDLLITTNDFFRHIARIPAEQVATFERDLTVDELQETLKTCADSAPGPDGIPYSYLKHFWKDFGPVLLNAWIHDSTLM